MIKVKDYKGFWATINPGLGISKLFMVRTIEELQKKLRNDIDADEIIMAVIIPSSDTEGKNNNAIFEKYTCVVYILVKTDSRNDDEVSLMEKIEVTEIIVSLIKLAMLEQASKCAAEWHPIFKEMDLNGIHTDPEWDVVGTGCEGWSVSFTLKSAGF